MRKITPSFLFPALFLLITVSAPKAMAWDCVEAFANNPYYKGHNGEAVAFCKEDELLKAACLKEAGKLIAPGEKYCPPTKITTGVENPCGLAHIACHDTSTKRWDAFIYKLKEQENREKREL